jgi:ATP synthase protein I
MSGPKYQNLADLLSIGIMLPACIGIGYGIGYFLDHLVGTRMAFKVIFLLFGIAAGFINLFRTVNKVERDVSPR